MAAFRTAITSTQRAFSRSCSPLLPSQANDSFTKTTERRIMKLAILAVVLGMSTSSFCSMKLSNEKQNCDSLKRILITISHSKTNGHNTNADEANGNLVSVGVKD